MKHRELRIAFSAACSIACVLLSVLWVSSYWKQYTVTWNITKNTALMTYSAAGGLFVYLGNTQFKYPYEIDSYALDAETIKVFRASNAKKAFRIINEDGGVDTVIPLPLALSLTAAFAALPWLGYRFSLRTLLIATTVIAVALGIIVWMTRAGIKN